MRGKKGTKENHIGYYLIMEVLQDLYRVLEFKKGDIKKKKKLKLNLYIYGILILSIAFSAITGFLTYIRKQKFNFGYYFSIFDIYTYD